MIISAWNSATSARAVVFTWSPSSDDSDSGRVAGYTLYFDPEFFVNPYSLEELGWVAESVSVQGQNSVSLTNLLPNTTYYLTVTAYDTNGIESDFSNVAAFNTSTPFPPRCSLNPNGTVSLSWDSRPDPTEPQRGAQFVVYYSSERFDVNALDSGPPTLRSLSVGRQTNATLASLSVGKTYYFAVAAYNATGFISDLSNVAELVIPPASAPKCTVGEHGEITVSWAPRPDHGKPGSVAGYNVYYSLQPFDSDSIQTSSSSIRVINLGNQTNTTITTLALNQTYFFAVAPRDRKGIVTDLSSLTQFLTPPFNGTIDLRPRPPLFLSVAATGWESGDSTGIISANWGPSPDPAGVGNLAGYILYYSTNFFDDLDNLSDRDNSLVQAIPLQNQTSAILTDFYPGQTYYFAVAAYRPNFIRSELSNIAIVSTMPEGTTAERAPAAPTSLSITTDEANADGAVRVSWDPSPDAGIPGKVVGYNLYYETQSGIISVFAAGDRTSVTLTNLPAGQTYYFGIAAYDANGLQSILSAPAVFVIPPQFDLSGQLPALRVNFSNDIPILTVQGSLGANMEVQSTTNPSDAWAWVTITNIVLTHAEDVPTNANFLEKAFVPASEIFADLSEPTEEGINFYRLIMSNSYATIANDILNPQGIETRTISVRLPDFSTQIICYVSDEGGYLDYNDQSHLVKIHPSGPKIREIATQVALSQNTSWISASEFVMSGALKVVIATVIRTDPPESDPR